MTLQDIGNAVGGALHDAAPGRLVTGVARYDSRLIEPGDLFVAFPGARADGHDFAERAVIRGAAAVLAGRPVGVPAVVVDDVLAGFGRLAATLVERATDLTVIGVTGSVGKTTTKDLLGQVLARLGPTVAPPGNLNNEIGVPATVSLIRPDTRYLVAELGARNRGDVAYLARLVAPRIGVVTSIGVSHLSEFGTLEHTTAAKAELVEALPADGHAVLNADDPRVAGMAARSSAPVTLFGTTNHASVRAEHVTVDESGRASFRLCSPTGSARVTLRLHGEHYVSNALAAAAAALRLTDDVTAVADALSQADRMSGGRMHVRTTAEGVTVVDDAYNASPASTLAALRTAAGLAGGRTPSPRTDAAAGATPNGTPSPRTDAAAGATPNETPSPRTDADASTPDRAGRRLVAVLGQMNELGPDSAEHHTAVGRAAAEAGVRYLVGVGNDDAGRIVAAAAAGGVEAEHVPDAATALALVRRRLAPGDVVLMKGSNAVGLQSVADRLIEQGGR